MLKADIAVVCGTDQSKLPKAVGKEGDEDRAVLVNRNMANVKIKHDRHVQAGVNLYDN